MLHKLCDVKLKIYILQLSLCHGMGVFVSSGVMTWACLSASRTGVMVFIDDVSNKGPTRINAEVNREVDGITCVCLL